MALYRMRSSGTIAYLVRKTELSSVSLKRRLHTNIRKVVSSLYRGAGAERLLPLEGHVIPWDNLKSNYVDSNCHLFTTLGALMRGQYQSIPYHRVDLFAKQFFPKNCTSVVDVHSDLPLRDSHERALGFTEWPKGFKYYFAIGAHPHAAQHYTDDIHETFIKTMLNPNCVAWGECGLDYFKKSPEVHQIQRKVFARQLTAAVSLDKPIVIHTRDAPDDTLSLIREHIPKSHNLHIHCFTSTAEFARAILTEYPNSFIGITGVITYRELDHIHEIIASGVLPLERILLETDSPYLIPSNAYDWLEKNRPNERYKRFGISHSGMIPFVAEKVAECVNKGRIVRGEEKIGIEEVLDVTRRNAGRMYRIEV